MSESFDDNPSYVFARTGHYKNAWWMTSDEIFFM